VVANNIGAMRRANGNAYAAVCRATLSMEVMTLIFRSEQNLKERC
jgi:hypothetical protein